MSTCGWCKAEMPPGTEYEHLRACSSGRRVSDREAAIRARVTEIEREYWGQRDLRDERTCVTHLARAAALVDAELAAAHERITALEWELAAARVDKAKLREALRSARDCIASPTRPYAPGKDIYDTPMMSKALRKADAALADGEGET